MEGSERQVAAIPAPGRPRRRLGAAFDVIRFILGFAFVTLGAGLCLEGAAAALTGHGLFWNLGGVNRSLEFFVGLMGIALGGLLVSGMHQVEPRPRDESAPGTPQAGPRTE